MNRKLTFLVLAAGLLILAPLALAQVTISNPLGAVGDFPTLLTKIAGAIGALVATLGTVMIIVAGILYLTSAGSPEKVKAAKTALVYAIAGIVIGGCATLITTIVLNILQGKS